MSKRDDDSSSDMEVGMTTAERRRRRRRGSLRVPSDNVPRRSATTPPVVAPVPEDPSLAMSIAYSFTNDASEPVPLQTIDPPSARVAASYPEPMAPEAMPTVIDPPSAPVESADFETQTREMSAVDLEALGLTDAAMSNPSLRIKTEPGVPAEATNAAPTIIVESQSEPIAVGRRHSDVEIEVNLDSGEVEATNGSSHAAVPVATPPKAPQSGPVRVPVKERHKTVALSDEDLEEVREAVRAYTEQGPSSLAAPAPVPAPTPVAPPAPMPAPGKDPLPSKQDLAAKLQQLTREREAEIAQAQALAQAQAARVEGEKQAAAAPVAARERPDEPMSVPDIDIQELERDAEQSGEFELDVQMEEKSGPVASEPRTKTASVPPPVAPAAAATNPGIAPPPVHAAPPPPPPPPAAQHKAPPVPPPAPAKKDPPKPAAVEKAPQQATARQVSEQKPRGKPWFVDLFDEDYLRTLPFLTPQATQAEAEFVIQAMGLSPGAQVLDVGCGYGRHAMELAARGFHVVGLDLSTSLLVRGGEEAQRRGLQINFVRGDMRELDFESQFDGAYCLFSTFGYFDDETNKKTVTNIARALKPGGRVLIEILNRDYVIADLPTRVWWEGDGCVVLEEVELNYFSSRIQVNRSVVFDDGRQLEQEISVRAYSLHEIGKLMHAAGFRVLEVSGAYQTRGRFFGNQSRHIIVLAERKDTSNG